MKYLHKISDFIKGVKDYNLLKYNKEDEKKINNLHNRSIYGYDPIKKEIVEVGNGRGNINSGMEKFIRISGTRDLETKTYRGGDQGMIKPTIFLQDITDVANKSGLVVVSVEFIKTDKDWNECGANIYFKEEGEFEDVPEDIYNTYFEKLKL